jgi:hypothetical protein
MNEEYKVEMTRQKKGGGEDRNEGKVEREGRRFRMKGTGRQRKRSRNVKKDGREPKDVPRREAGERGRERKGKEERGNY